MMSAVVTFLDVTALCGLLGSVLLCVACIIVFFSRDRQRSVKVCSPHERSLVWAALMAALIGNGVVAYSLADEREWVGYLLFTVPLLFALLPLLFLHMRYRALAYAVCAFLLAGQAGVGMSGYGLVFAPSGLLLVLAGFVSLSFNAACDVHGERR